METVLEKKEKTKFRLPEGKVHVVPIRRKGSWLPNNHEANFLFKDSYFKLTVPRNKMGELVDPLTEEEREYFESSEAKMAFKEGDLSTHRTTKDKAGFDKLINFWTNFTVKLTKDVLILDKSNPMDYLRYKVLLSNSELIAPSAAEKFKKATYKFALVEEGWEDAEKVKASSNKKDAYKFFGKIDSSIDKMKDFLSVYQTTKSINKSIPANVKSDFLIAELENIIEKDLEGFLSVANDKDYNTKLLINKALKTRALEREGIAFRTPEGVTIGQNLKEAIVYLTNPEHSEDVLRIKSRVENSKQ